MSEPLVAKHLTKAQQQTESCMRSVKEALAVLAMDLTARGKMKQGAERAIITPLLAQLEKHNPEHVLTAIEKHTEISPWFPAYAELMTHIRPLIDSEQQRAARTRRNQKTLAFMGRDNMPPPTPEQCAKAKRLVADLKASAAELEVKERKREPFIFRQATIDELEKVRAKNSLMQPFETSR